MCHVRDLSDNKTMKVLIVTPVKEQTEMPGLEEREVFVVKGMLARICVCLDPGCLLDEREVSDIQNVL